MAPSAASITIWNRTQLINPSDWQFPADNPMRVLVELFCPVGKKKTNHQLSSYSLGE